MHRQEQLRAEADQGAAVAGVDHGPVASAGVGRRRPRTPAAGRPGQGGPQPRAEVQLVEVAALDPGDRRLDAAEVGHLGARGAPVKVRLDLIEGSGTRRCGRPPRRAGSGRAPAPAPARASRPCRPSVSKIQPRAGCQRNRWSKKPSAERCRGVAQAGPASRPRQAPPPLPTRSSSGCSSTYGEGVLGVVRSHPAERITQHHGAAPEPLAPQHRQRPRRTQPGNDVRRLRSYSQGDGVGPTWAGDQAGDGPQRAPGKLARIRSALPPRSSSSANSAKRSGCRGRSGMRSSSSVVARSRSVATATTVGATAR